MLPYKILVVDDDPHIRNLTVRLLETAGYKAEAAETGEEALRIAPQLHPDLILMDVVLPGLDGMEVCRRIKRDPDLAESFVILLSSLHTDSVEQARGLDLGADGYIARPVTNRELIARVQACLRIRDGERALRTALEARDQLSRIINRSPIIAFVCRANASLETVLVSENVHFLGYTSEELIDERFGLARLLHHDDRANVEADFSQRLSEINREVRCLTRSGEERWMKLSAWPNPTHDAPDLYEGTLIDLTEIRLAEQARLAQMKREMLTMNRLSNPGGLPVSSQAMGLQPLSESLPETFQALSEEYAGLLEKALEGRTYKIQPSFSTAIIAMAEQLGVLNASARDVIDVHIAALKIKERLNNPQRYAVYTEEGRLIALELMGHLVLYYRKRAIPFSSETRE